MPAAERDWRDQALSAAIAMATAGLTDPDGNTDLTLSVLRSYVEDGEVSDGELVVGLYNLVVILLVKLENRGVDPLADLQDIAARFRFPPPE